MEVNEKTAKTPPPLVLGVICNGLNIVDINNFVNEYRIINRLFKDNVIIHFIGLSEALPELKDIEYCYSKPVSIIHFYKHIHTVVKPDVLFIPLIRNEFNESSEGINKFLDMAIFGCPVFAPSMYPYSETIKHGMNGFLYNDGPHFIDLFKDLLVNRFESIKVCGAEALNSVILNNSYES